MKSRVQKDVIEDRLTINQSNTRSKTGIENSESIPIDLVIEILSRLPAKSVARFHCVSKLWDSLLHRPYFTELFLTRSLDRPQLLFACHEPGEFSFFSSPLQPQNPDESIASNRLTHFSFDCSSEIGFPVHGWVCLILKRVSKVKKETVPVIFNPSTGQSLTLPKVKTRRVGVNSYFGYDPIDEQFKLLSMTMPIYGGNPVFEEYQVLTLGNGKPSWRPIECSIPHYSQHKGVCINGVLYYPAIHGSSKTSIIVCFDVRSEKFRFITLVEAVDRAVRKGTLVNYNGKLCSIVSEGNCYIDGISRSIELWVLEDAEKHEWSEHRYVLPALWQNIVGNTFLRFVGVTQRDEIVLSSNYQTVPFYVFYFNIKRNTFVRVGIQGMEAFENKIVYIYLGHVEDVKLMQVF